MCASRGRVVLAQHQYAPFTQSLFQLDGDGSPMTASSRDLTYSAHTAPVFPVGGSEAKRLISIYPQPLSRRTHLGHFSPHCFSGSSGLLICYYYVSSYNRLLIKHPTTHRLN
jgi:hypothetical protein